MSSFKAIKFEHRQRAPWDRITHVRLLSQYKPDTQAGERMIAHIRRNVNKNGVADLKDVIRDFPCLRKSLNPLESTRTDLRHMANDRHSGKSTENKGLIELGWMK